MITLKNYNRSINKFTNQSRMLIILNCFFNYKEIERTLISIKNNNYNCDIIFLENPSKYSSNIKNLVEKYGIYKHYICNDNIEGNIFTLFINQYPEIINNYQYIALSEADVILDSGAIQEAVNILDLNDDRIGNISINLHLDLDKYKSLPIDTWIGRDQYIDNYVVGDTGYQFIIFKKQFLFSFIDSINKKELSSPIALGVDKFYGISDSNLGQFNKRNNKLWIRTRINKLDHIGWEQYIHNDSEYVKLKNENLKNGKIRSNYELNNYYLTEII